MRLFSYRDDVDLLLLPYAVASVLGLPVHLWIERNVVEDDSVGCK
jgi:hypothetical protein